MLDEGAPKRVDQHPDLTVCAHAPSWELDGSGRAEKIAQESIRNAHRDYVEDLPLAGRNEQGPQS